MFELKGFFVSLISPFKDDYSLNINGFKEHVKRVIDSDLHGMVVAGTNGEFSSLSDEERKRLYKIAVDESMGNKIVICNIGCESTCETQKLATFCKEIGADGVMVTPPYFIFPNDDGIFQHYKSISENVNIPIILFNIPYFGHPNLHSDLVHRLTEIKNIIGIKEANFSIYQMMDQIRFNGNKISILSGLGANVLPAMSVGAKGVITTWPEFIPEIAFRFYDLIEKGDLKGAREIHHKILPLARSIGDAPKIKAGFEMIGLPAGPPRPPLLPSTDKERELIRKALINLGVLKEQN